MKKVIKLIIIVIIVLFIVMVIKDISKNPISKKEPVVSNDIESIFNASQYSRITTDELVSLLGEPKNKEDWSNETSKGTFQMTLYDYDIDNAYVEFITYEDSVVKVRWFSNEPVEIKDDFDNVFKMFNISIGENARKTADTGTTYKFSPVSDKVAKFEVYNFDADAHTFDTIYITYNLNYFED